MNEKLYNTARLAFGLSGIDTNLYWPSEILKAIRNDGFSEENEDRAADWTTCACGLVKDIYNVRNIFGVPLDLVMRLYGGAFYYAIENNAFALAVRYLCIIEYRAQLLAEGLVEPIEYRMFDDPQKALDLMDYYIDKVLDDFLQFDDKTGVLGFDPSLNWAANLIKD